MILLGSVLQLEPKFVVRDTIDDKSNHTSMERMKR